MSSKICICSFLAGLLLALPVLGQEKEEKADKFFMGLTGVYAGLSYYETYQTVSALEMAKRNPNVSFVELNPVMRPLVERKPLLVAVKTLEVLGTVYLLKELRKEHPKLAYILLAGIIAFRVYASYNNYQQWKKFQ